MSGLRAQKWATLALLAALAAACSEPPTVKTEPRIELTQESVDFGEVPVLNEAARTLEIRNAGRAPLTIESVEVEEAGAAFAVRSAPTSIGAGEAASVALVFVPAKLAPYRATLMIHSDDLESPALEVPLLGTGFTVATLEADRSLDFGEVCEGSESVGTLTLRSTGTADLILEEIRFADGTAPEFQFVSSTRTPATLAKGGEMALAVRVSTTEASPAFLAGAVLVSGTDPAHRTVSIPLSARVNRAPKASVADVPNAAPGATVDLDGSASTDPDNDLPLTYSWALKSSPLGSRSQPAPLDQPAAKLTLDLPGQYTVGLTVTDSAGCVSKPFYKDVLAKPAQQLLVELVWDNLDPDLDLHLTPDGTDFFGPQDCYFAEGHTSPDWGNPAGNPTLDRDALTGYGPEIISYGEPAPGKFKVMVDYFSDHRSKQPATLATVRVYEFGVVKAEVRRTLSQEGRQWQVLTIDWPGGAITNIDVVQ
ncbi:MAG TPA: choice-of-anchor D domain-containing protein [Myxococcales bacterium]|jgi:hypothetical protein